jgi:hypothetical protein
MIDLVVLGASSKASSAVILASVSSLLLALWSLINVGKREKNLPPGKYPVYNCSIVEELIKGYRAAHSSNMG